MKIIKKLTALLAAITVAASATSALATNTVSGSGTLELIPATDKIASSGTTALGSESVGFFANSTIDFNIYAAEVGWYDIGVKATNWEESEKTYTVTVNNSDVNQIKVSQTVNGISATDDYFVSQDFWLSPGYTKVKNTNYTFSQSKYVWLVPGENSLRIKSDGSTALHRIYVKKADCNDAPDGEYAYDVQGTCDFAVMIYTGYGTANKTLQTSVFNAFKSWSPALASFEVAAPKAGKYQLNIYAGNGGSASPLDIYVNSDGTKAASASVTNTGGYTTYTVHNFGEVYLNEGINLLTVAMSSGNAVYFPFFTLKLTEAVEKTQADTTLPVTFATTLSDINKIDASGDMNWGGGIYAEYTVNVAEAGEYTLTRYGSTSGNAGDTTGTIYITVNGKDLDGVANPNTSSYVMGEASLGKISLVKGKNVIRLRNENRQAFLRSITLSKYVAPEATEEMEPLADPEQTEDGTWKMGFTVTTDSISDYNAIKVVVSDGTNEYVGGYDLDGVFGNIQGSVQLGLQINGVPGKYVATPGSISVALTSFVAGSETPDWVTAELD